MKSHLQLKSFDNLWLLGGESAFFRAVAPKRLPMAYTMHIEAALSGLGAFNQ